MLHFLITIAKAENAIPEQPRTSGELVASFLTTLVIILSCVTVARCFLRWQAGQVVMPIAKREPLYVPVPLAILGVVMATLFASTVILDSMLNTQTAEPTESAEVAEVGRPVASDAASDEQASDEQASGEQASGEQTSDEHTSGEIAGDDETGIDAGDADGQTVQAMAMAMQIIEATLSTNSILLLLLGVAVWVVQADGPGRAFRGNNSLATNGQKDVSDETPDQAPDQASQRELLATTESASQAVQEPWNLFQEFKFAGMAFLMALAPTFAVRLIMLSLMEQPKSHPIITLIQTEQLPTELLVLLLLIAAIVAPVVEELLYRVVVLGGLRNRRSPWVAVAVSSVLFSFAHGFPDCLSLLPLAFVLGYTYIQRRSYRTVMLVHLIFNSFNMALLLIALFVTN